MQRLLHDGIGVQALKKTTPAFTNDQMNIEEGYNMNIKFRVKVIEDLA